MGKIRKLVIYSDKITSQKKFLVYSDLHMGVIKHTNIDKISNISELNPEKYDYILLPGDIVHSTSCLEDKNTQEKIYNNLKLLTGNTPSFLSLGNHEKYHNVSPLSIPEYSPSTLLKIIKKIPNIIYLANGLTIQDGELEFSAINNSYRYYIREKETPPAYYREYQRIRPAINFTNSHYSILLTHDPKSIYRISKAMNKSLVPNTDLIVSGHMHNGYTPNFLQSLMKGYGFISPDYTIFPELAYGVKEIGDSIFLVNGAVNISGKSQMLNELYGINCTQVKLIPSPEKKLVYKYK